MSDNNPMEEERSNGQAVLTQTMAAPQEEKSVSQEQITPQQTGENMPLHWLREEEVKELQSRWNTIQIIFVDGPRSSVEQADALVADTMERVQKALMNNRSMLSQRWINGTDISTEDLRTVLQDYRSFLNRLLAI